MFSVFWMTENFKDGLDFSKWKDSKEVILLSKEYEALRLLRNDINHAGFDIWALESGDFQLKLSDIHKKIISKIQ
ncbi:MAG: hypothetical protein RIS47_1085 [Bacteroidota bacterium]|jgi:hypothetical protein